MDNGNLTNHEVYDSFYASEEQTEALKKANADGALIWPVLMMLVCLFSVFSCSGIFFPFNSRIVVNIGFLLYIFFHLIGLLNMFSFMLRFSGAGTRKNRFALYVMKNMPKLFKSRFIVLMSFAMSVGAIDIIVALIRLIMSKGIDEIIPVLYSGPILLIGGFIGLMILRKKYKS